MLKTLHHSKRSGESVNLSRVEIRREATSEGVRRVGEAGHETENAGWRACI